MGFGIMPCFRTPYGHPLQHCAAPGPISHPKCDSSAMITRFQPSTVPPQPSIPRFSACVAQKCAPADDLSGNLASGGTACAPLAVLWPFFVCGDTPGQTENRMIPPFWRNRQFHRKYGCAPAAEIYMISSCGAHARGHTPGGTRPGAHARGHTPGGTHLLLAEPSR